jgi:hypothetical protein
LKNDLSSFPSFKKKLKSAGPEKKLSPMIGLFLLLLCLALGLLFSFRYLIGSKVPREEIYGRLFSASEDRRAHLLMEWLQQINSAEQKDIWRPSVAEHLGVMQWVYVNKESLKQNQSPQILALHLAGWGQGNFEAQKLDELSKASLSPEAMLALALYYLRQEYFSPHSLSFFKILSRASEATQRKLAASNWEQCVRASLPYLHECKAEMSSLLYDAEDEVRWNAAMGILREKQKFPPELVNKAQEEFLRLYELLLSEDNTFLSRLEGEAYSTLAREIFRIQWISMPEQTLEDLKKITKTHPHLRLRNEARIFLNSL